MSMQPGNPPKVSIKVATKVSLSLFQPVSAFVKKWWWVILAVLVVIGTWRVRLDVEVLDLLPPDQPTVQGLKIYQEHFANARELIITLRSTEAEKAERLAGKLAASLRQATNLVSSVSWQPPWMEAPGQAAEVVAYLWFNQSPQVFGQLTNRLAPEHLPSVLADTKEALATSLSPMDIGRRAFDPYDLLNVPGLNSLSGFSAEQGQQMFVSSDGCFRILFVQARPDLSSYKACSTWMASIREIVIRSQADSDWQGAIVRYTGRPAFVTEIANSMRHDLSGSVIGTSIIIAVLFWLAHRRWLPMLWLLALLGLVLVSTVGLGGLLLGTISVVSLGFAAVLLGLAVDYAVVHYQEALSHPQLSVPEIRRAIAPSILWAAITTISAFLVLNLGGLPGLAELGTLVGIGVALAALVMVVAYLPPLFPERRRPAHPQPPLRWWSFFVPPSEATAVTVASSSAIAARDESARSPEGKHWAKAPIAPQRQNSSRSVIALTFLLLLIVGVILALKRPGLDRTANAIRLQDNAAEAALAEVTVSAGIPQDPLWVIASGIREREVYQRLDRAQTILQRAVTNGSIGGFALPTAMWPREENQEANRVTARWLAKQGPVLHDAALAQGFNTNGLLLTDELVRDWDRAGSSTGVLWPTNQVSQWLLKQFVARSTNEWFALGLVYRATNRTNNAALENLSKELKNSQVLLCGWDLLGATTLKRVEEKLWQVVLPMVVLVLTSLWLTFRRMTEVALGLGVLALSGLCLLATMAMAGWSWNLLNLMAVPLILGTGVDYCIFIQLALRRHGGDLVAVRRSIGRALMLCGGTAAAGFGSLGFSGNRGMASLGKVCAVGIAGNVLISIYLLPAWWRSIADARDARRGHGLPPASPSGLYRAGLWRFGSVLARILPFWLVKAVAVFVATLHFRLKPQRRELVVWNVQPACRGGRPEAEKVALQLYRNFGVKLAELWRMEAGVPVRNWLTHNDQLDVVLSAWKRKEGVLFVTVHLGNWEHGGLLLERLGIPLTVLTQAEPEDDLTELRLAARSRYGIKTLVVGKDPFALVEVIKQLQDGVAMAIAIDRPPKRSAVLVDLFGKPFEASIAVAELARASGCALVGVTVVRQPKLFAVEIVGEFPYDRRELGKIEGRRALTQQIVRAFEPRIREHLDQWYQFVPIWTDHCIQGDMADQKVPSVPCRKASVP